MADTPFPSDDHLLTTLRGWAADARLETARRNRVGERWQLQIAAEEMRFSGVLLDAWERAVTVQLLLEGGRSHSGTLAMVGQDFCAIAPTVPGRPSMVVALAALAGVQVEGPPRRFGAPSSRSLESTAADLHGVLAELLAERAVIRFVLRGTQEVRAGELAAVGDDVASLALGPSAGPSPDPTYTLFVPLTALAELWLA